HREHRDRYFTHTASNYSSSVFVNPQLLSPSFLCALCALCGESVLLPPQGPKNATQDLVVQQGIGIVRLIVAEGQVILPPTVEMVIPGEGKRVAESFVGMLRL